MLHPYLVPLQLLDTQLTRKLFSISVFCIEHVILVQICLMLLG